MIFQIKILGQIWLKQKTKLTKKGGGGGKKRKNVILANQNSRVGVIWLLYFYSGQKWKQKICNENQKLPKKSFRNK